MTSTGIGIGTTITVRVPVLAYSRASHDHCFRQLLPGTMAVVFGVAPCVRGRTCPCGRRHREFYAVEFVHADGMKDRAGVMPCNVVNANAKGKKEQP